MYSVRHTHIITREIMSSSCIAALKGYNSLYDHNYTSLQANLLILYNIRTDWRSYFSCRLVTLMKSQIICIIKHYDNHFIKVSISIFMMKIEIGWEILVFLHLYVSFSMTSIQYHNKVFKTQSVQYWLLENLKMA